MAVAEMEPEKVFHSGAKCVWLATMQTFVPWSAPPQHTHTHGIPHWIQEALDIVPQYSVSALCPIGRDKSVLLLLIQEPLS